MGLNNINSKSTWGQAASDINTNFTTIDSDLKKVKNATTRNKGYFSTSSELISAFPTASKGDIAYVGSSYPYDIWKWNGSSWANSGSTGGEESVNLGNYHTAEYVDEKLSELSEEISGLRTETDQKLSELGSYVSIEVSDFVNGYINTDGIFKLHQNFQSTEFIRVSEGNQFYLSSLANSAMCKVAYYDKDKIFLPNVSILGVSDASASDMIVVVPNGVHYVRFSNDNTYTCFEVKSSAKNSINELDKNLENITQNFADVRLAINGYIITDGTLKTHQNYRSTDYIGVSDGDSFHIKTEANSAMCKAAYYDEDKTFLKDISIIGSDSDYTEMDVVIPSGVSYVRFSTFGTNGLVEVKSYNIENKIFKEKTIGYKIESEKYKDISTFIKELSVFNYELIGHDLTLYDAGVLSPSSFYIWVYDNTLGKPAFYGIADYDSIPKEGIERVNFTTFKGTYNKGSIHCIVNWANFGNVVFPNRDTDSGIHIENKPSAIEIGIETPLENVINGATILRGNYTLNSEITLSKGKVLIGDNCFVKCSKEASIIMSESSSLQNINFVGDWDIVRESYQSGYSPLISEELLIEGSDNTLWGEGFTADNALIKTKESAAKNTSVLNCTFDNFDRCVIYLNGGAHQDSQNPQVRGCYFNKCWCGIYGKGEFTRISENCFFQCVICVNLYGGNISKVGNVMKGCDVGYYYSDGKNNGHGEMVGCEMAHCNVAGIYIKKLQSNCGDIISGCQIVDAPIIAEECHSLLISGCRFDTWIRIAVGGKNAIINNLVGIAYKKGNPLYNVPNDTKITINTPINNATNEEINLQ